MGICGRYCVQDSALVIRLFNKLQTWIGLCEMAKTCNVPIFYLYTQGQQIKVYSQLYKYCMYNNYVVEKDGYIPKDDEHYVGATVFEPKAGVYDIVLPFDFASLYNFKRTATSMLGYKHTEQALLKMIARHKDKKNHPFFGKTHTQETKELIRKPGAANPMFGGGANRNILKKVNCL